MLFEEEKKEIISSTLNPLGTLEEIRTRWQHAQAVYHANLPLINSMDDPLAVHHDYITAIQSLCTSIDTIITSPKTSTVIQELYDALRTELKAALDRSTKAFVKDEIYRNDPRYWAHWKVYAEWTVNPEAVFMYLREQGIAKSLAGYWEEFARFILKGTDSGRSEEDKRAHAIELCKEGLACGARPVDRLKKFMDDIHKGTVTEHTAIQQPKLSYNVNPLSPSKAFINQPPFTNATIATDVDRPKKIEIRALPDELLISPDGKEQCFQEFMANRWRIKNSNKQSEQQPAIVIHDPELFKSLFPSTNLVNTKNVFVKTPSLISVDKSTMDNHHSSLRLPSKITQNEDDDGLDHDVNESNALRAVNPDDLTHISVYKDCTADVKAHLQEVKSRIKQATGAPLPTEENENVFFPLASSLQPQNTPSSSLAHPSALRNFHVAKGVKGAPLLSRVVSKIGKDSTLSSINIPFTNQTLYLERELLTNQNPVLQDFVAIDLTRQGVGSEEVDEDSTKKLLVRVEALSDVVRESGTLSLLMHEASLPSSKHLSLIQFDDLIVLVQPFDDACLGDLQRLVVEHELLFIYLVYRMLQEVDRVHKQLRLALCNLSIWSFVLQIQPPDMASTWASHYNQEGGGWPERGVTVRSFERAVPISTQGALTKDLADMAQLISGLAVLRGTFLHPVMRQLISTLESSNKQEHSELKNTLKRVGADLEEILLAPDPGKYRQSLKTLLSGLYVKIYEGFSGQN